MRRREQGQGRRGDADRFPISLRAVGERVDRAGLRTALQLCLDCEDVAADATIGLLLCGDRTMRRLNREFRGKDRTTDVLSFLEEPGSLGDDGRPFLGELAISLPQCRRQAEEQDVDPGVELVRLLVHGVLHLLGYDHEDVEERRRMQVRERRCRARIRRRALGPGLLQRRSRA